MATLKPISAVLNANLVRETEKDVHGLYINGEFVGILTEPFNPDFSIQWDEDGYADLVSGLATGLTEVAGAVSPIFEKGAELLKSMNPKKYGKVAGVHAGAGQGLMAKKMFSKADYWNWTANVRIVDFDGTGLVFNTIEMIKKIALPSISSAAGFVADETSSVLNTIQDIVLSNSNVLDSEALTGAMSRSVVFAPQPVHIRIGRYGNTQGSGASDSMKMVIENFSQVLSNEYIEGVGPMYADLSITFSSIEPMVSETFPVGKSRITIKE